MMRHFWGRILLLGFCCQAFLLSAAPAETPSASVTVDRDAILPHLAPGAEDGRIAYITAGLLQQLHYSHRHFDDAVSSEFLDRYLESLDPQRLHFLETDLAQFERYRTNLDDLTITPRRVADTTPAFEIFSRFLERLKQRTEYAQELLKTEKFEFTSDDRIDVSRREQPYPRNLAEAKALWRQRLRYEYLQEKLNLETAARTKPATATNAPGTIDQQIVAILSHRYHRILGVFTDWNNEDVLGVYLTALAHVYDPHSDYFNKAEWDSFKIQMNLELFGIGAELISDDDGYCRIQRVLPHGPASNSKQLRKDDRIVAVAQGNGTPVDVVDKNLTKIVQLIRGPKGTEVRLTIMPGPVISPERKVVTLIRDEIPLEDSAAKGKIIELPNAAGAATRLGVIDLPSFYATMESDRRKPELAGSGGGSATQKPRSTSADMAKLLAKFKQENVKGVILDLRRNGGGMLEEAIKVTGLFIKSGPVVQASEWNGDVQVYTDDDSSVAYDGPLIVLTSRFSASASEIVAGALQDYGRAIIVGDSSTHGKGTVQTVQDLASLRAFMRSADALTNDPGAVKITIRKFYRASGASTQLKGVMPDIVLPSILNYAKDIGESSLENPMPWDTIKSTRYEKLDLVQPYLPDLLKFSTSRIATNQDFAYVREDIERFRKQQADKTVSLNEQLRLKEKAEADARQKAREKELRARADGNEKVYDISLQQAELPGLPAPTQKTNTLALKSASSGGNAGTNVVASVDPVSTPASELEDMLDETEKPPLVDTDLNESERILIDYLSLLKKGTPMVATQPGQPR